MDFFEYYKNDTNPNKPKKLMRTSYEAYKKAKKYNLKLLKEGAVKNTFSLHLVYNPKTKRFLTNNQIKYDLRKKFPYTKPTKVKVGGKTIPFSKVKNGILQNIKSDTKIIRNPKFLALKDFLNDVASINVPYKLIVKDYNNDIIIDTNIIIEQSINQFYKKDIDQFRTGGSPSIMKWELWNDEFELEDVKDFDYTFILTKETKLSKLQVEQSFLDGVNHCVFEPILNYFEEKIEETKSKDCKKKYMESINKIKGNIKIDKWGRCSGHEGYLNIYKNGVPQDKLDLICNDLKIGLDLEQPFINDTFIKIRPLKKARKVFKFINTRLNHIELNETKYKFDDLIINDDAIEVDKKKLIEIFEENKTDCIVNKRNDGIASVKTNKGYYVLGNDYNNTIKQFEKESKLDCFNIDALKEPQLQKFINEGTHFNLTIDFEDTEKYKENIPQSIKHIDISKAYTQFKQSKYYKGFVGHITHFRKVKNYDRNGLYYITNLDLSNCNKKFLKINDSLMWFMNCNIYTDAELRALKEHGGIFDVKYGAYGKRFDFEFNEDMINKKDDVYIGNNSYKLPYYSKFCGQMASLTNTKSFFMYGDAKYFKNILNNTNDDINIYDCNTDNEYRIVYKKKHINNKRHITAQITAYQRLNILEQLVNMDIDKIIRVCVDGIYYYDHECKINNIYGDKTDKMTFRNDPADEYLSALSYNSDRKNDLYYNEEWIDGVGDEVEYNEFMIYDGAGGNGKTHLHLTDKGLKNYIYIAPSWKLSTSKYKEYGSNASVLYRFLNEPYMIDNIGKYGILLFDEASQYTEKMKNFIIKKYGKMSNIYFLGDLGYQLPPIDMAEDDIEMTRKGLKCITLEKNYRFKDDQIISLVKYLRDSISNNKPISHRILKQYCKTLKLDDFLNKKIYTKEDIILTSENKFKDQFKENFKDIEKYKVMDNTRLYKNGEIIFDKIDGIKQELQHGYTFHSVQGETFKQKIFIDMRKMKSKRMLYTAISRANYISQLYLIF